MRKHAFDGIKVVDLAAYIAGGYCSGLLADMGAQVVKVESWEGDAFRANVGGFQGWNRGKRGLVLDLRTPEGKEVLYRMVKGSDVVVENYRPGVAQRLGVDFETLQKVNQQVIYCTVTAYGNQGSHTQTPGFDPLFQAMSGAMAYQGGEGNPPVFLRVAVSDYAAAILAAWGVAMALFHRARTGRGQRVETCLANSTISVQAGEFLFVDGVPWASPRMDSLGIDATHRLYRAKDAWLYLGCDTPGQWRQLCDALGREDLADLWEADGTRKDDRITQALEGILLHDNAEQWIDRLARLGLKTAPVRTGQEISQDPAMLDQGLTVDLDSPEYGPLKQTTPAFRLSETPGKVWGPAPALGQHTDEVLRELGYSGTEIQALRDKRVVP
ncbi:MAG: CoA transferase [Dehalococcoidia bacterium]